MPVIASGGAGRLEHFAPAVEAGADAVLAATVFHFGTLRIGDVKQALAASRPPGPRVPPTARADDDSLRCRRSRNSLTGRPGWGRVGPGPDRTRGARAAVADEWGEHRGSTTREGFAVLGVAIRREPEIFVLSTVGSVLFGALTVADAWVLGWATDHVVDPRVPHRRDRRRPAVGGARLFLGVAILRAVGIVARRLGAGVMQYRMQAHTRRAVTRQYLSLPMEWHQRHPTGQLLSNAYSDVEAAWGPIAPLPMARRHRRDDGDRRSCRCWSPTS